MDRAGTAGRDGQVGWRRYLGARQPDSRIGTLILPGTIATHGLNGIRARASAEVIFARRQGSLLAALRRLPEALWGNCARG